jgi:hypothetical protein
MLRGAPAYEVWVCGGLLFLGWVNGLFFKDQMLWDVGVSRGGLERWAVVTRRLRVLEGVCF